MVTGHVFLQQVGGSEIAHAGGEHFVVGHARPSDPDTKVLLGEGPGTTVEQATLGGGCFWCVEAAVKDLKGVQSAVSGYAGGQTEDPSYAAVCSGRTGHAEVVQVTFDPDVLPYRTLLDVFFSVHDPTTLNRQGADVGTQYRSVIFTHDDAQAAAAEEAKAAAQEHWDAPIVTEISPLPRFWPAEAHHQDYYARNPSQGYCAAVISPKLGKLRAKWSHLLAD